MAATGPDAPGRVLWWAFARAAAMPDAADQDRDLPARAQEDRHRKMRDLVRLTLRLSNAPDGMTLDQMVEAIEVSKRTAERYRDDLVVLFGLEECGVTAGRKRWRLPPPPPLNPLPRPDQMASLLQMVQVAQGMDLRLEAGHLDDLHQILLQQMAERERRRIEPDLEALAEAHGVAHRPGPREATDPTVLHQVQRAILACLKLEVRYADAPEQWRVVHPLGILLGTRRRYLVAFSERSNAIRQYRMSRILDLRVLEGQAYVPPEGFSLRGWSEQSFAVFQEAAHPVVLRFLPTVAEDVRTWRFHPGQTMTELPDGGFEVRFTAGGMRELAWHLVTWAEHVRILEPEALRQEMRAVLAASQAALADGA